MIEHGHGNDLCFITGCHTFQDAAVELQNNNDTSSMAKVEVPNGEVVMPIPGIGEAADLA